MVGDGLGSGLPGEGAAATLSERSGSPETYKLVIAQYAEDYTARPAWRDLVRRRTDRRGRPSR